MARAEIGKLEYVYDTAVNTHDFVEKAKMLNLYIKNYVDGVTWCDYLRSISQSHIKTTVNNSEEINVMVPEGLRDTITRHLISVLLAAPPGRAFMHGRDPQLAAKDIGSLAEVLKIEIKVLFETFNGIR